MKENNKKIIYLLISAIVILSIVILGLTGYIIYDKVLSHNEDTSGTEEIKSPKTEEDNEVVEEQLEIKSITYKKYNEIIDDYSEYEIINEKDVKEIYDIIRNSTASGTTTGIGVNDELFLNYKDGNTKRIVFLENNSFIIMGSSATVYQTSNNVDLKDFINKKIK